MVYDLKLEKQAHTFYCTLHDKATLPSSNGRNSQRPGCPWIWPLCAVSLGIRHPPSTKPAAITPLALPVEVLLACIRQIITIEHKV